MASAPHPFDLRRFLQKFRRLLQVQNPATEAELPPLLGEYGQLCEQANQRLRDCFVLFQRGQYTNAVALSDREPNLLDQCTQLEIPERDMLASVAQILGLYPPTLVDRDLLAALQESHDKGSTVAANLKLLHRLTLVRAPLPARLFVMRRLSIQNPNHPYMDGDIRLFEKAWYQRANEFAQTFVKQGRPEVIEEIVQDLQEGGYLENLPSTLLPQLQTQVARAKATRLPMLAKEIRKAYVEESYLTLRQLAERWKSLTGSLGNPGDDAKYDLGEALDWVRNVVAEERKSEQRNEARLNLVRTIEAHETTRDDLDIAYQEAKALGGVDADLERRYFSRLARFNRRRMAIYIGSFTIIAMIALLVVAGIVLANRPDDTSLAEREEARQNTYMLALKKVRDAPADANVEDSLKLARELATSEKERQEVVALEKARQAMQNVLNESKRFEFSRKVTALKEQAAKLLADARRGWVGGHRSAEAEGLRNEATKLRDEAGSSGYDVGDLTQIEKTLAEIEPWKTLAANLLAFRKEMKGAEATLESLERLARFLDEKVVGVIPDADLSRLAKLARASLPSWTRVIETQDYLRSRKFLDQTAGPHDWMGLPPSGPLAEAIRYAEMIRQRNPASAGSEAAKVEERLTRRDMAGLWRIKKIGDETSWAYRYATTKPVTQDKIEQVQVLMGGDGRVEQAPIPGNRVVIRAPQSEFAETASKQLWQIPESDPWEKRVAEVYDTLIESKRIDPLLQLDLARGLLSLASKTSAGYREVLEELSGYSKISGREGDISGNWLDPGLSDELASKRDRAKKLIDDAPRLGSHVDEVLARDERRLNLLAQGLVVLGWVCRDDQGVPSVEKFVGASPAPGSHLFTAVEGKWIDLGVVSSDGKSIELNPTAEGSTGWPVFAVLLPKSRVR